VPTDGKPLKPRFDDIIYRGDDEIAKNQTYEVYMFIYKPQHIVIIRYYTYSSKNCFDIDVLVLLTRILHLKQ
jgi:hypothetical protein